MFKTINFRVIDALAVLATAILLLASSALGQTSFVMISSTKKIEKIESKSNLFPWEATQTEDGLMIVSNSCGFVNVTYKTTTIQSAHPVPSEWTGLGRMGEWCGIADFVFDSSSLISFRNWHGQNYILHATPIFTDGRQEPFVAFSSFIESNELADLVENVYAPQQGTGCYEEDNIWYQHASELGVVSDFNDQRCFTKGIYLKRIPSLQQYLAP